MMTSTKVVEISVEVANKRPLQDYTHLYDHRQLTSYDPWSPFLESPDNFSGPESYFM